MTPLPHAIRAQRIDIAVDSSEVALALQPRLEDFNRRSWLPTIERILDEVAPADSHLVIDRIDLDLGSLRAADLERDVEQRLERELRRALRMALNGQGAMPASTAAVPVGSASAPQATLRSEATTRRRLLEHELRSGTLPFWAPASPRVGLQERVAEMVEADPQGLAETLRKEVRASSGVLERLVMQLGEPTLRQLVGLLKPEHAALILAYVANLQHAHRARRFLPRSDQEFSHVLWVLVQGYLLRDAGSQFNRKSFVGTLVRRLARRHGHSYGDLLASLGRGLRRLAKQRPVDSSLPAIIQELIEESRAEGVDSSLATKRVTDSASTSHLEPPHRWPPKRLHRYPLVDLLQDYSRLGIPPWQELMSDGEWSADRALEPLLTLPRSLLKAAFRSTDERSRTLVLWRAIRQLPVDRVSMLLLRLLPAAQRSNSPFREGLRSFTAQADEPVRFLAGAIAAALDGRPIDFERLLEECSAPSAPSNSDGSSVTEGTLILPHDLRNADAQSLASALAHLLRFGKASPVERGEAELLSALAVGHPAETRHFLRTLGESPELESALWRATPAPRVEELIEPLVSGASQSWALVWRALAEIPSPYRPRSADLLRWVVTLSDLPIDPAGARMEEHLVEVLRSLFTWPLAEPVSRFLLDRAQGWSASGTLPPAHLSAFEASVTTAAGSTGDLQQKRPVVSDEALLATLRRSVLHQQLLDLLRGEPGQLAAATLQRGLRELLRQPTAEVRDLLREGAADSRLRRHWVEVLAEGSLALLCAHLAPRSHRPLLDAAELLSSAWQEAAGSGQPSPADREAFWLFMLEFLTTRPTAHRSVDRLVQAFFERFVVGVEGRGKGGTRSATSRSQTEATTPRSGFGERWLETAGRLAHQAGQAILRAVLLQEGRALLANSAAAGSRSAPARSALTRPSEPPLGESSSGQRTADPEEVAMASRPPSASPARRGGSREDEPGDPLYLANAGLVLVAPFLPHLLTSLDYLDDEDSTQTRLRDPRRASRAVHLLQWLVDGSTSTAEPSLVLNKLLCGLPLDAPVEREVELNAEELAQGEKLLKSILANWTLIADSSVAALRETFLQREGRLRNGNQGWELVVQRKSLDVLVDQIPWSFSVVFHRWMTEAIYVTW